MIQPRPAAAKGHRVLIRGGLGFLGQHLVSALLSEGAAVSILCRSRDLYPQPAWASDVDWFELRDDGSRPATLLAAVSSPSLIYDFAGWSGAVASNRDPLRSLDQNCAVHLEFLRACQLSGNRPRVVFPSSWLLYKAAGGAPVSEEHPMDPRSMYAAHKLCGEHYLRIYQALGCISFTICRISNPYGFDPSKPATTHKVLNGFVQSALANTPISLFGDGRQRRDFIYISDLIDGLLRCGLAAEAENEVFNLSSGKSYELVEAVEIIRDLVGAPEVEFKPWPAEFAAVEPGDYTADITKAMRVLGFEPKYDLRDGLERTIFHYRHRLARTQAISI